MYYKQGPSQWEITPHTNPYDPKTPWDKDGKKFPPEKPKVLTIADIFPNLDRWALGLDPVLSALESAKANKSPSYPPYNVLRSGDNYVIEMALAGLKKSDIEITVKDRTLTIATIEKEPSTKKDSSEVVHQGIASRAFTTNFALGEYIEVTGATMEDGILTVTCENVLPEEKKPKSITIK